MNKEQEKKDSQGSGESPRPVCIRKKINVFTSLDCDVQVKVTGQAGDTKVNEVMRFDEGISHERMSSQSSHLKGGDD